MSIKEVLRAGERVFLKTHLVFEDSSSHVTDIAFKLMIIGAVERLHGQATAAFPIDVVTHEVDSGISILRVPASALVKIWSALTLLGEHDGNRCTLLVKQISPFLISLADNSRNSQFN